MKNVILLLSLSILLFESCSSPESVIKKDLDSRFTKFEIVEIKKDSSNVYDIAMRMMGLKLDLAKGNASMAKAEGLYWDKKRTYKQTIALMDSVTTNLNKRCVEFMNLQFSKKEACYLVKYRIFKDELKIEKEEYYYFRDYYGGKTELLHRPYNWDEYLGEEELANLLDESNKYYLGFLRSEIQQ